MSKDGKMDGMEVLLRKAFPNFDDIFEIVAIKWKGEEDYYVWASKGETTRNFLKGESAGSGGYTFVSGMRDEKGVIIGFKYRVHSDCVNFRKRKRPVNRKGPAPFEEKEGKTPEE